MWKRKSARAEWVWLGPFGRLGRALGFRWVFPVGTVAVPYHPLLLPLTIALIMVAAVNAAVSAIMGSVGGEATWAVLLVLAALLGAAMSLPVVVWFLTALGARLIQAVMILVAMVLLGIEAQQGRVPAEWGVVPGAYLALFVVQALLGKAFARHLQRGQEAFARQPVGQSTVALAAFDHGAQQLIARCDLARLHCPPLKGTIKAKLYHWLTPEDATALAGSWGEEPPAGWKLMELPGGTLLVREKAPRPRKAIVLRKGPYTAPLWLVTGLRQVEARGEGRRWYILEGSAQTVRPIPLFNLFRFTSISGPAHNQWMARFPRGKALELPDPDHARTREFASLFLPRGADGGTHDKAALPELRAEIANMMAQRMALQEAVLANVPAFRTALSGTAEQTRLLGTTLSMLIAHPHLLCAADVGLALDWLERERDARSMAGVRSAASLIEAFPLEHLAPHAGRLRTIFDSQKLALQWDLSEVANRKVLPRGRPLWAGTIAGFGLYLLRPQLYEKLGLISVELAGIEQGLSDRLARGEAGLRRNATLVVSARAAKG